MQHQLAGVKGWTRVTFGVSVLVCLTRRVGGARLCRPRAPRWFLGSTRAIAGNRACPSAPREQTLANSVPCASLCSTLKQGIFTFYVGLWVSCHLLVYRSKQADA
eukprot:3616465-Prymnesium_polylepis.1